MIARTSLATAASVLIAASVTAQPMRTMLAFESEPISAAFPSEKDAGLNRALGMAPDRIREILASPEFEDAASEMPEGLLDSVFALLGSPVRLAVMQRPDTGAVVGVLSFQIDDPAQAGRIDQTIARLIRPVVTERPTAHERFEDMYTLTIEQAGEFSVGLRETDAGTRYEIHYGDVPDPDRPFDSLGIERPEDVEILSSAYADAAAISRVVLPFIQLALGSQPNGQQIMERLAAQGIIGDEAMSFVAHRGFTDTDTYAEIRAIGAKPYADPLNLPTEPVDRASLRVIPADATAFTASPLDLRDLYEQILQETAPQVSEEQIREVIAQINAELDIDLERDLIDAVRGVSISYLSESTGGGALTSLVSVVRLADPESFNDLVEKARIRLNTEARNNIPTSLVGVRIVPIDHAGHTLLQVQVPGVPSFITPTFALHGDWMLAALTPNAAAAALDHMTSQRSKSVLDNPRFLDAYRAYDGRATTVSFIDSHTTIGDGYPMLSFAGSALANTVRSPADASREPGLVVPTLASARDGIRPIMSVGVWDEEDFVTVNLADRSSIANLGAVLGTGDAAGLVGGFILGGFAGAAIAEHADDFQQFTPSDSYPSHEHDDEKSGRDVGY